MRPSWRHPFGNCRAACLLVRAIDARHLIGRNHIFFLITLGEHHKGGKGADRAGDHQPPDMPDQGEAHLVAKSAQVNPAGVLRGILMSE